MPLILPGNVGSATAAVGYNVANSCRFNSGDSPALVQTPSAGNADRWTLSMWFKRCDQAASHRLLTCVTDGEPSDYTEIGINGSDLLFWNEDQGGVVGSLATNRKFRDVSAWMHLVFTWDSANGTAGNRMRIYINGTEETSFSTDTNPSSGSDSVMGTAYPVTIGSFHNSSNYQGSYFAEVAYCNGQAYAASDFGEFDEDSPTIWKPKDISGLTFGTGGFYLDFEDSANLGADVSGQGNDFTVSNLDATDQATDTPTNNFCTMNPLDAVTQTITLSEGNCKMVASGAADDKDIFSTFGITAGKWYWEVKTTTVGERNWLVVSDQGESGTKTTATNYGSNYALLRGFDGAITTSATENSEPGSALNDDDVACFAFDADNGQLWVSDSANIDITGTANVTGLSASRTYHISYSHVGNSPGSTNEFNFGNPVAAPSSGNADGNGYGSFEYAPPSGYLALCTKNLGSDGG